MAFAWTSPAFSKIKEGQVDFQLDQYEMSLIAVLGCTGRILSPIPTSYAVDIIGRKGWIIIVKLLQSVHWWIIYCFHNVWALYLARLFCGLYVGAANSTIPIYVGETSYKTIRGQALNLLSIQFILGTVLASAFGGWLSYDNLALASAGLDFFPILLIFMIPESPYFQTMKNNMEEATASLQWLRGREDIAEELDVIQDNMKTQMLRSSKYIDLFKVPYNRKVFTSVAILIVMQQLCGVACLIPYGSFVFPDTWYLSSNNGSTVLNCTYLVMCTISGFFVDSWGRKCLLFFSTAGATFLLAGCAIWFFLRDKTAVDVEGTEWMVISFLIGQAAFYSTGYFYIPSMIMAEVFPMNIKPKAHALCSMISGSFGSVIVFSFLPLTNSYGLYTNFIIYSSATFIATIYCIRVIETKNKSLEEIQSILEDRRQS